MPIYYVNDNAQNNGEHEVHSDSCPYLSYFKSKTSLDYHSICVNAVVAARKIYTTSDGCATCSPTCHNN